MKTTEWLRSLPSRFHPNYIRKFSHRLLDLSRPSRPQTVIPRVNFLEDRCVPAAPVGIADYFYTGPSQPLTIVQPGVLSNDYDPDGQSLSAQLQSSASSGSLSFNTNGSFTYTPSPGFVG